MLHLDAFAQLRAPGRGLLALTQPGQAVFSRTRPQTQGRAVRLLVEDALDDGGGLGRAGAEVPGAGVQGGVAEEGLDLSDVGAALAGVGPQWNGHGR